MGNPMKRKSRISFFLGVFVTLLICGGIIYLLFTQMTKLQEELKEKESAKKVVYVLNKDIKSGETVTSADLMLVQYSVPVAGVRSGDKFVENPETKVDNVAPTNAVTNPVEAIAKINLLKGTILTSDMVYEDEIITNDLRIAEYNTILLQAHLEMGDYIDVRLMLPNGQDYLVVSKKYVEDITEKTLWIKVNEEEIITLTNATVESYIMTGSILYATKYVDPGLQEKPVVTYPVSSQVLSLINANPNITNDAKRVLSEKLNGLSSARENINNTQNGFVDKAQSNIEKNVQEQIKKAQEERQRYLEELGY